MKVSLERLFCEPPITGPEISGLRRHPDGRSWTYVQATAQEGTGDLWSFEPDNGSRIRLVEGRVLRALDRDAGLNGYEWLPGGRSLLVAGGGKAWAYHLAEERLEPLLDGLDEQVTPHLSPTGSRLAFVRAGNLCVRELTSGAERNLTDDGSDTVLNGKLDWVYWEELGNRKSWRSFEWSPDGERIAFIRLDQGRVPEYPLVDARETHAKLTHQRYPQAGDPNSIPSLHIAAAADGALLSSVHLPDDGAYVGPALTWTADSERVAWTRLNRSQRVLELRTLGVDGRERALLSETDPYWLNRIGPPHFLDDGSFLWLSERTGRAHVYHYTADGEIVRQLTEGDWQVEQIHTAEAGDVLFTGTGTDARERRLYRVPVAGGAVEALTPEHACAATEYRTGEGGVVTTATPEAPAEKHLLRAADQEAVRLLAPAPDWQQYEWAGSEFIDVRAADGTLLHGRLIKPPHFDPAERYPVVVHVYGGPHAQNVRYTWAGSDPLDQLLSQEGVLVWKLDNRGTWGRGHAFEAPVHRRLYVQELADQLEGVAYLKSLPCVDPERIGITGWSYGGSMTLYALTRAPEVWRCGAAGAPVTDWKLYDSIYTERYMGTPEENPEGYAEVSLLDGAVHLRAPLLLIHGTDDDNVHLQNTLQFVDRLSQHRKPYELLLQPGQKHGFTGPSARTYLHERLLEFFLRQLRPGNVSL